MEDVVVIAPELSLPTAELSFRATRSGGPGGQHVNTSSTRVELLWDVYHSPTLTPEQRDRIRLKLKNRIGADGVLRLTSSGSRSQHQNKEEVTERFAKLIAQALKRAKPRRPTKPTKASREARLRKKKKHSETKKQRGRVRPEE